MTNPPPLPLRPLGKTGLSVSPVGYGAFKIGRNQGTKYQTAYPLPTLQQVQSLVDQLLACGVQYFDTAPAYGISEMRLGQTLPSDRSGVVLSTKVGEIFSDGVSTYDFSQQGVKRSIEQSKTLLKTQKLDIVFIHSNGDDLHILHETDVVSTLVDLKERGSIGAIGFSGKTLAGANAAMAWADALMVEYHLEDRSHEALISSAAEKGIGVVVKKGLASGRLPAKEAIEFVLSNPGVSSLVIGGLNFAHIEQNLSITRQICMK